MAELTRARDELEAERLIVKQRVDEMDAKIVEKRNAMKVVDKNIQNKADKITEKQVKNFSLFDFIVSQFRCFVLNSRLFSFQLEIYNENDSAAEQNANTNAEQRKAAKIKGDLEKLQAQEQECNKKLKTLMVAATNHSERIPVTNTQEFLTSKIKETETIIR